MFPILKIWFTFTFISNLGFLIYFLLSFRFKWLSIYFYVFLIFLIIIFSKY